MGDIIGISQSGYSHKESGYRKLTYRQAQLLEQHSGKPAAYWMGDTIGEDDLGAITLLQEDDSTTPDMNSPSITGIVHLHEPANPRTAINRRWRETFKLWLFRNDTNKLAAAKDLGLNYTMLAAILRGTKDVPLSFLDVSARQLLFNMNYVFLEIGEPFLPLKRVENLTPTEKALHTENQQLRNRLLQLEALLTTEKKNAA